MSLPKCLGGHIEDIDSLVKEMECLEEVSDDVKVVRTVTTSMAMGLISSRELIDLVYIKRFPDNDKKAAVVVKGVDHDLPVAPKLVRGKHFVTGLIMEVVKLGDKDVLEIKHIEELDFSGNVPSKVIESFIPSELMGRGSTLKKNHKKLEKIRAK
ncbi:stAR-related lipid transfer protein 5-like [Antedon mediterranea]|uniref:stAR-related lipid transfer protein 5-like n=1 Tax=Antedon mediterranea TaxID=105859 RepID=UPI003AF7E340